MFGLIVALIFSILSLIILDKKLDVKSKKVIAFSVITISVCCIGIRFFGIKLNPMIELYLGIILTVISLFNLFRIINEKKINTVFAIITIIAFGYYMFFASEAIKNVTVENVEYTCTYPKLTGMGETRASYYKKIAFVFVKSQPSFVENYGIYMGWWDNLLDHEPYEVYYYD